MGTACYAETVVLTKDNHVSFRGEVDGTSVTQASIKLLMLANARTDESKPIYLVLDCPGGSVYAGEQFIQTVKSIPNLKTVTLFAASMCAGFVEAIPGERLIAPHGVLMFHRASGSFEGQFEDGELEARLALWKTIVRSMEQRNADRMSMPIKEYKSAVKDELWLYGSQAVDKKAADKVVDITCAKELLETKTDQEVETIFGSMVLSYSNCPMFRSPLQ